MTCLWLFSRIYLYLPFAYPFGRGIEREKIARVLLKFIFISFNLLICTEKEKTTRLFLKFTFIYLLIYSFVKDYHSPTIRRRTYTSERAVVAVTLEQTRQASSLPVEWHFPGDLCGRGPGVPAVAFPCSCCNERLLCYRRCLLGSLLIRFRVLREEGRRPPPLSPSASVTLQPLPGCHLFSSRTFSYQSKMGSGQGNFTFSVASSVPSGS